MGRVQPLPRTRGDGSPPGPGRDVRPAIYSATAPRTSSATSSLDRAGGAPPPAARLRHRRRPPRRPAPARRPVPSSPSATTSTGRRPCARRSPQPATRAPTSPSSAPTRCSATSASAPARSGRTGWRPTTRTPTGSALHADPAEVTSDGGSRRRPDPESTLTGTLYECNPVRADMVITDADSWLFRRHRSRRGEHVPGLVGAEYDRVTPRHPPRTRRGARPLPSHLPWPVRLLRLDVLHDSLRRRRLRHRHRLLALPPQDQRLPQDGNRPQIARTITAITTRLLRTFAAGPLPDHDG